MSMEDEYNIATRYRTVRKHLDSLGYKQAFTLDVLPLIEKLLADLIQTTESLKHFKSIAQENIEAHTQLQSTIDPYKCDNVRLVQECNQLHLDLIKEKENHQKQIKDSKKEIYKLERECNDLQLASSRNLHRIKELEIESAKKSKKILELQGRCLKPTISNVGLASKKRPIFPLRRPVIESEPLPKTGIKSTPLPNLSIVEPKIIDLLSMADHKMNCLSHEVTKLKGELSLQIDNVQTLKSQLTTKEKEILRLKKMLEGGRPYSAVSKDCVCIKGESNFVMSNQNIDDNELKILQQEKLELEQQLKEALNKQHDAMSQALKLADRNEELEKELRDIDHIALAVEADCNSAVKENNKRVSKLQEKLENVMARVHILENELSVEHREVQELRANLEACRSEKLNIQRTLEFTLDEKKQMTNRINELTVIEKNLNNEIERLAKENEKQKQDVIQLQYSNKLLKEQMITKEILLDDDNVILRGANEKGRKNDYDRGQNRMEEACREREFLQNANSGGYNNILKQLDGKKIEINDLQQVIEQLRRERDFYKNEYKNIKDTYNKTIERDHVDLWSRIRELKCQLSEKENALDELQREKKELYCEKTNLEIRLQTCKAEHKTPYRSCNVCKRGAVCNCSPPLMKDIGKTKDIIERLEHERDIARADVDRLIEERDALRERLKMAAEAHTSEQRRLKENLTEVETRLKHIEKERQELLLTQGARRATIKGLEDQLQDLREELRRTKQELGTQRTQYFQLRALQDQTDQALGDAQNQLTQSDSELNKALDRNKMMEGQQLQLENQVKELQQEINNLKANMTHLDHRKDQLLMVLDEKTERIAILEREVMLKEQQVMGSEQQIRDLQHKNDICVDQSADQNRQLRSMQLEIENLQRQLQTASYDRENAIQENRRVQDDLAATICEVRNLQRELETSRGESFDLKRQLQTYVSEIRRAEELLNRKENERTEMLNHFRSLSLEATVLENNNHSLESEAAEARGALQSARDRLLDFERQIADKDSLIRSYETQISELTQNVASMETQLRQQGEQKHRAEADLTAVRDLCMKLDQQKDVLMQQLDDKDTLKAQYDTQIAKLKAEQAVIQDQMNKDRATVERLEILLDQARQESITVQANNQELQNEMSRLRQKMSELQNKLSSESTKLRQYQTQAAEYCKQISDLRRQVTNERFDRARKEEENRRSSEGFPDSLAQTSFPNSQISNETNDAKYRSLNSTPDSFNNEPSREYTGQSERCGMKIVNPTTLSHSGYSNLQNSYKCNNHAINVQPDVPCINIIVRSDCKMHSSQYNYVQKENSHNENTLLSQANKDSVRTEYKALNIPQSNSFNRKYDHFVFGTKNCSDVSQSVGFQYERKYNQGNKNLTSSNILQIQYNNRPSFSYHAAHSTKISSSNKLQLNLATINLFFNIRGTILGQMTMLDKDIMKNVNTDDSIETNFNSSSVTKLESSIKQKNENNVSEIMKTDLSPNLENIAKTKQNFIKFIPMDLKSTLKNCSNLELKSTSTLLNSKFTELENFPKSMKYKPCKEVFCMNSLTALDIAKNLMKDNDVKNTICINETNNISKINDEKYEAERSYGKSKIDKNILGIKKFTNLAIQKNIDTCTNTNCNGINHSILNMDQDKYGTRILNTSSTSHTFLQSRKDFHCKKCETKCISTINNTVNILQNMVKDVKTFKDIDMTKYNSQNDEYKNVQHKNIDCNCIKEKNDVILSKTKHHFFNQSEIMRPECMKMLQEIEKHTEKLEEQLIIMNKNKSKKKINEKLDYTLKNYIKQQKDMITQNPEKKNIYIQKACSFDNIRCSQDILLKSGNNLNLQLKQITGQDRNICRKASNIKDISYKTNNMKSLVYCDNDYLKNIKNVEIQCVRSFHIFDSSNLKPLATSTPKKVSPLKNEKSLHNTSNCSQTSSIPKANVQITQIKKIVSNQLKSSMINQENKEINPININSNWDENAIIMLHLTKDTNGKCLKCKYRKSEFLNFRPKSITNSRIMCNKKSTKHRLSRQKVQIPIVFKLMCVKCKSQEDPHSNEYNRKYNTKSCTSSRKVSDLVTSVYTQSSNLQITTATSVSCISFSDRNDVRNSIEKKIGKEEGCILS